MTILPTPDEERAIQKAIEAGLIESIDQLIDSALQKLPLTEHSCGSREEAVRRMQEFGEQHHLSLGEPITRILLHQSHRL